MTWAINTKHGTHKLYGNCLALIDHGGQNIKGQGHMVIKAITIALLLVKYMAAAECCCHQLGTAHCIVAYISSSFTLWYCLLVMQTFTSAGNEGVIYSLSWSPSDIHSIVASTSRNGAFILDVDKGKVIRRLTEVNVLSLLVLLFLHMKSILASSCLMVRLLVQM